MLVAAGFGPGLVGDPANRRGMPGFAVILHGTLSLLWLGLYLAQAFLVRAGNRGTHRRLGWAAVPLAGAILVSGYLTTVAQADAGSPCGGTPI